MLALDWTKPTGWPKERFDVIIGSDIVYNKSVVRPLLAVLTSLLKPQTGLFLFATANEASEARVSDCATTSR